MITTKPKKHFDIVRKKAVPKKIVEVPIPRQEQALPMLEVILPQPEAHLPKIGKIRILKFTKIDFSPYFHFSIKKQTFFAKRLSFLIKAGVPMLESIQVIKDQTKSKTEMKILNKVFADVANGQTLATSLSKFKGVFGNFAINIIKAGESSGTLIQSLTYLADELKKKELLRKKILSALLYPLIITIATFGITGMLIVYIFPKILPIFSSLKAELPLSTRMIIVISNVVRNDGWYILLGLAIFIASAFLIIKKFSKVRFIYHGLILRMPLFGNIAKNYNLTNTLRTLGLLLKSGLSLNESLIITSDTTENVQYRKPFNDASVGVMQGKNMSQIVAQSPNLFPDMITHMISVGEKTGNLSNTLIYLSEYYENEFEDLTKNLSSSIEPVLMVLMGVLVGFVAISIITPIYGITQHLNAR